MPRDPKNGKPGLAHAFNCNVCSRQLSISDNLFEKRIAGKRVTVRCKHCGTPMTEDGTGTSGTLASEQSEVTLPVEQPSPGLETGAEVAEKRPAVLKPPPKPPRSVSGTSKAVAPSVEVARIPSVIATPAVNISRTARDEYQEVSVSMLLPSEAPPAVTIRRTARDEYQEVSVSMLLPSEAPSPASIPSPELDVAATLPDPSPFVSPSSTQPMHGERELTPPATTLALDSELRSGHSALLAIAPKKSPWRMPTLRELTLLGGAGSLLVVALVFSLGTFQKRAVTPLPGFVAPARPVAAAPALPTAPGVVEAATTDPSSTPASGSAKSATGDETIPDYVSKPEVLNLTGIAMRHAQGCHPRGHAVGTSQVFITFAPNGSVSDARVEGEPLASAPVGVCILDHARSIRIAKFEGAPFTVVQTITLR